MRTEHPKATLTLSGEERTYLLAITRSRSLPAALTLRAKIVLACEREPCNAIVPTRLGVGAHSVTFGPGLLDRMAHPSPRLSVLIPISQS